MTNTNPTATPPPLPDLQSTINAGARLLYQNRPGEAAALLEPLYQQAPTHPDLAINLGGAYILQRKWDRAVRVLQKAAEANPNNVMLWINLGAAQLGNIQTAGPKQQERAIRAYERALAIDPKAPNVHYHLGLIYKDRGERDRAMAAFQRALEVLPTDKDARYWLDQLAQQAAAEQNTPAPNEAAAADGAQP
ncbi:MAG: tetratricopeptide repeat protein [Caldilinea sp. CFX5]|nr:tetratricopeptide repeat protein [Caldilinea sp. CFX5]